MSKFWIVDDVAPEDDSLIRQLEDDRWIIGPHEVGPDGSERYKLRPDRDIDRRILNKLIILQGADAPDTLAAQAEMAVKRRVSGTVLRRRALALGIADTLRAAFADDATTITVDGITLSGADIHDGWMTELAERGSIAVNDPAVQGFLTEIAGLDQATVEALCAVG